MSAVRIVSVRSAQKRGTSWPRPGVSGTSSPTGSFTKSLGPPEFAPITGVPQAMHSMKTSPNGSLYEGKQPTSAQFQFASAN